MLTPMAQSAQFISFEGGEGSGKTMQIALLAEWLKGQGANVLLTREPGGEEGAEKIRELLVRGEPGDWEPMAETLLFCAARAAMGPKTQPVEKAPCIKPWQILAYGRLLAHAHQPASTRAVPKPKKKYVARATWNDGPVESTPAARRRMKGDKSAIPLRPRRR